jgi:hypothetical protein
MPARETLFRGREMKAAVSTAAEDNFLIANWAQHTTIELAAMMRWPERRIRKRGLALGLPGRKAVNAVLFRHNEAARVARQELVTSLDEEEKPRAKRPMAPGWPDGWSITPPTRAQLMGRR